MTVSHTLLFLFVALKKKVTLITEVMYAPHHLSFLFYNTSLSAKGVLVKCS